MGISGLNNLLKTQETRQVPEVQRISQEREGEGKRNSGSLHRMDSVSISAEGYRMSEAMRENYSHENNEQKDSRSGITSGLPGETASSNVDRAGKEGAYVAENGVLEGGTVRALPEHILARSDQHLAEIKEKGTKVLFEFSDDGSISIKPDLSVKDYLTAQTTLREWQMHSPGLGF